jgi:flagellar biosynthetic protein FliQ
MTATHRAAASRNREKSDRSITVLVFAKRRRDPFARRQHARHFAETPRAYRRAMEPFDGLLRETLVVTALLALPVLALSAAVGTVVAIVQAATQVQEQTLTLLPKLLAVGFVAAVLGSTAMHACAGLFADAVHAIPAFVSAP